MLKVCVIRQECKPLDLACGHKEANISDIIVSTDMMFERATVRSVRNERRKHLEAF